MSQKTLFILFSIFVILGSAASYSWWGQYVRFYNGPFSDAELNFFKFTESATDKIRIIDDDEEKAIVKENGVWKVNGFVADRKKIEDFFDVLSHLTIGSLVSKNPANHKNFEVTEGKGIILALTIGDAETLFVIGKSGAAFSSFYARLKGSDNVYEVSGNLRDKISQSVTAWRDKTVVDIQKESIQSIEIDSQAALLVLTKNEDSWNAQKGGKQATLDDTTTNRLLAALNPLEASGFLSDEEKREFEKGKGKTVIRVFGEKRNELAAIYLFKKNGEWWGHVTDTGIFYKIPSFRLSDILLKDDDIFKDVSKVGQ